MKKLFLLLPAFLFFLSPLCAEPAESYKVTGFLPDVPDSTEIAVMIDFETVALFVARDTLLGGKFSIVFSQEENALPMPFLFDSTTLFALSLRMENNFHKRLLWLEPGREATVTGPTIFPSAWKIDTGRKEQEEWDSYYSDEHTAYHRMNFRFYNLKDKMHAETDSLVRQNYEASLRTMEDALALLHVRLWAKEIESLESNEPDPIWLRRFNQLAINYPYYKERLDLPEQRFEALFFRIPAELSATPEALEIRNCLFPTEKLKTGDRWIDIDLIDTDGKPHVFSDYPGRYLLLAFTTWYCGPCRMAVPELRELAAEYADSLTVINVNIDKDAEFWKTASANQPEYRLDINLHAVGSYEFKSRYGINGTPTFALIGPDGRILDLFGGYGKDRVRKKIRQHLRTEQPAVPVP